MTDDRDLEGLDPYDLMDAEAARLERFFSGLPEREWGRPSRCEGWSVRDVLAHLASSEDYNRACLEGTVAAFLAGLAERGATDLATANDLGIRDFDGSEPKEILDIWRTKNAQNRAGFRARDGADVDTTVGAYPARWQAFHLAFEYAVHADDVGVPVAASEREGRTGWQVHFSRFALKEAKPEVEVEARRGATAVRGDGVDTELPDELFVAAAAARVPDDAGLDQATRKLVSVTP
jgi:uncharacterized protein (TIGR03083 family)